MESTTCAIWHLTRSSQKLSQDRRKKENKIWWHPQKRLEFIPESRRGIMCQTGRVLPLSLSINLLITLLWAQMARLFFMKENVLSFQNIVRVFHKNSQVRILPFLKGRNCLLNLSLKILLFFLCIITTYFGNFFLFCFLSMKACPIWKAILLFVFG